MNWSLLNIFKNFTFLRYSLGITLLFNGFPIVFFLRDTMGIMPKGSIFTGGFLVLGLVLMLPMHLFKKMYKPNTILFNLCIGFILITFYYFFFHNSGGRSVADMGNFVITFGLIILLLHMPNEISDTLLTVLFVVALFSNLTLVYSLLTNPNWSPGMRAAVTFDNDGLQSAGNPHITARNGVICLVSALVLVSKTKGIFTKVFLYFTVLFSLAVVVMSLAKSSYLGLGLMALFYFVFKFKFSNLLRSSMQLFRWSSLVVLVFILGGIRYFLNRYGDVFNLIMGYYYTFEDRIMDVVFTSLGVKLTEAAEVDHSAMGRVSGFKIFKETLFSPQAFMGKGYKSDYLDIPLLESLVAYGIIGFLFFAFLNLFLFLFAIREIRKNTYGISTFLAYFFISMSVLLATNGRPTDVTFWFPYLVMVRFLGIKYFPKKGSSKQEIRTLETIPS